MPVVTPAFSRLMPLFPFDATSAGQFWCLFPHELAALEMSPAPTAKSATTAMATAPPIPTTIQVGAVCALVSDGGPGGALEVADGEAGSGSGAAVAAGAAEAELAVVG